MRQTRRLATVTFSVGAESTREFHDPFVYVPNLPQETFVHRLRTANTLCEYKTTSEGYVAAKFGYTLSGDTVVIASVDVYTNVRSQMLYKFGGKQYRAKFCGINSFIDKLDCPNTVLISYSHNIKAPLVEKLWQLHDDSSACTKDGAFDASVFVKCLQSAGVDTTRLATKRIDGENYRNICLEQISALVRVHKLKLLPLRGVSRFEGNMVYLNLSAGRSFVSRLPTGAVGLPQFLILFGLTLKN